MARLAARAAVSPFNLFDGLARVLPGPLVTAGIDALVLVLLALGLSVADLAKLAEQLLALALFTALLLLAGGAFCAALRRRAPWRAGWALAVAVGVPLALVAAQAPGPHAPPFAAAWTLAFVLAWALLLTAAQRRLSPPAAATEVGAGASADLSAATDRRRFMVYLGGAAALVTVVAAGGAASLGGRRPDEEAEAGTRWSEVNRLPNADAAVQPAPGTRPELTPLEAHYRIDINLAPVVIDEKTWRLRVEGLVAAPLELTLDELRAYESVDQFVTLSCISNPIGGDLIGTTRWTGVPLVRLLDDWNLDPRASHLRITAADGFFEIIPVADIRRDERIMLCYAWDGVPLRFRHGFPLRIYIPDRYGMKQPKWIERIEAVDAWEPGYWVVRGWDREARMKATAVIDTVAQEAIVDEGGGRSYRSAASRTRGRAASPGSRCASTTGPGRRRGCASPCRARPGCSGASTGPSNRGSTCSPCAASRATARRRSPSGGRRTRAGRRGWTGGGFSFRSSVVWLATCVSTSHRPRAFGALDRR